MLHKRLISLSHNQFIFTHMKDSNIRSHYIVNISNDKANVYDKIMLLNFKLK